MRLGGPVSREHSGPDDWIKELRDLNYSAAYCPVDADADDDTVRAYVDAAKEANVLIAEVGAWSNPISPDDDERAAALEKCKTQLALADRVGANCCVNVSGSRGERWAGPHPKNLTHETFDLVVESVREIIDAVKPGRTFYTLETMPWMFPDSADCYLRLVQAIDRDRFAVHLDPVNLICSPQRYYQNAAVIRECFERLRPHIKSCHAKDIALRPELTTHLDEVRPGMGGLDYTAFLTELDKLEPDTPLMLEHLGSPVEYVMAATHIRSVAKDAGIAVR
ncbi:MAG: sugar phosphate isomerase/epimerase family protein [Planctomycetota bacterium]